MFSDPWLLCLIVLTAAVILLRWLLPPRESPAIPFSGYDWLPPRKDRGAALSKADLLLRGSALFCLVLIVAGIGYTKEPEKRAPSAALVIVLDVSSSMTADDFPPTSRLEEAKNHLRGFTASNRNVEVGLIVFAASPRLVVPVTLDHTLLSAAILKVRPADLEEDGTAIGSGIASAVNRLRAGSWGMRRILLITDGVSNRGTLAPLDAARLARLFGIRIDVIGIGTGAVSRFWVPNREGAQSEVEARIDIDDESLEALAAATGGRYQRVRSSGELGRSLSALGSISQAVEVSTPVRPGRPWQRILALTALCLLTLETVVSKFIYSLLPG